MNRYMKGGLFAVGGLVALLAVSLAAIFGISNSHFNEVYQIQALPLVVSDDSAAIDHGRHIAHTRGCMDCHGDNLGGAVFIEDPAMGRLSASNLTRGEGGIGRTYTPEDWDRAVRHGVRPDGKPLLFMPAYEYNHWSDYDLTALIAYMNTVEPVDNVLPENRIGALARALYLKGDLPLVPARMINHEVTERPRVEAAATLEYGAYLAPGCMGCHGEGFSGGQIPGVPPDWPQAANITMDETGLAGWTEQDFAVALREGRRPDGSEIRQPYMPIAVTKNLHDYEITALWLYLNSIPASPAGNR